VVHIGRLHRCARPPTSGPVSLARSASFTTTSFCSGAFSRRSPGSIRASPSPRSMTPSVPCCGQRARFRTKGLMGFHWRSRAARRLYAWHPRNSEDCPTTKLIAWSPRLCGITPPSRPRPMARFLGDQVRCVCLSLAVDVRTDEGHCVGPERSRRPVPFDRTDVV